MGRDARARDDRAHRRRGGARVRSRAALAGAPARRSAVRLALLRRRGCDLGDRLTWRSRERCSARATGRRSSSRCARAARARSRPFPAVRNAFLVGDAGHGAGRSPADARRASGSSAWSRPRARTSRTQSNELFVGTPGTLLAAQRSARGDARSRACARSSRRAPNACSPSCASSPSTAASSGRRSSAGRTKMLGLVHGFAGNALRADPRGPRAPRSSRRSSARSTRPRRSKTGSRTGRRASVRRARAAPRRWCRSATARPA